jgi:sortase A
MLMLMYARHGHNHIGGFWKTYNVVILLCILAINIYVIGFPFWPAITFHFQKTKPFNESAQAVEGANIPDDEPTSTSGSAGSASKGSSHGTVQRLVIPKLRVNSRIFEGSNPNTLNKGIWRRPNTSTPEEGGNIVLAGHRITYAGFRAFYHLDQLVPGDEIKVYWNNVEYRYRVTRQFVTEPSDVSVENESIQPILTLYTCTPIPSSTHRLVIQATRIEDGS